MYAEGCPEFCITLKYQRGLSVEGRERNRETERKVSVGVAVCRNKMIALRRADIEKYAVLHRKGRKISPAVNFAFFFHYYFYLFYRIGKSSSDARFVHAEVNVRNVSECYFVV